ncbi:itaconate CoA-transferase [Kitasatospora sp. MAA4]|uniref:CaiB/BaiF CoA transferase family protein n=1 Tax=Kitasatospora sp. MAA4 TaxID=3035093 RepID=UPI0024751654|nr:CaiB/BaiF CoA-transferase family protein [Kitasatospora sp. MAA4]MDH6135530.1 itaconate CoA-transferase [Kitasatospora sp. MAA4]
MTFAKGLPLDGVTVVALEHAVAAPLATRHLADLGARVVKVERPDGGDFARGYDRTVHGMASHFVWLNRGKESITLDLKTAEGRAVLAQLVAGADVFVQNLAPGAAARLGFGSAALRERDPRLITVDMSGYGSTGPYRDKRAYDMLIQCEAGLASVTGPAEQAVKTGVPTSDIAAGMYALSATMAALVGRAGSGEGAAIEISMFEATAEWLGYQLYYTQGSGVSPGRAGLSHPSLAPYDAYPTADDRLVLIGVQNDREWARFAAGFLDRPELADDPLWATNVVRARRRRVVDALVGGRTATMTVEEVIARLDGLGIASARLNEVGDLLGHPQLAARDRWRPVATPVGEVRGLLPPFGFAGVELPMGPVPALGEHTEDVLAALGYGPERIAALRAAGAL